MDNHLKEMIKKYHAEVNYIELERKGYLLRGNPNMIFVNSKLSEDQAEEVIIHELGHLKHDHELAYSYKDNYNSRIICECGANTYLIKRKIKQYIDLGNNVLDANWLNLAKSIGIEDYSRVRKELSKYFMEN